ncbi:Transient receptor potential cation channel subfamily M member-like 2 [Lamellibrachia satsuma]|nr:Transient receptor potential cation channel subfamily M member-like 2 [Lamellibrachia satsuma]
MKVDECGDKSILMIAHVEYMEFMGETCCDVVIQNQWTGKLHEPTQPPASRGVCVTIQDILHGRYFTPRTKFALHMVFYAIMLGLFSVVLLTELPRDSQDSYIGPLEWVVCVLVSSWSINEAVQFGSTCMGTNGRTNFQFDDVLKFLLILALFIVSYGVPFRALLFPKSEFSWALLRDIVYLPYWQMYGELQLEDIEDVNSRGGLVTFAIVLFAVYMMMCHILLLNLLIATFTHSITRIHDEKKKSWHFGFRSLVREYERCIDVPPPFSTLAYVYQLCRWLICGSRLSNITEVKKERRLELQQFEKGKMYKYLRFLEKARVAEHADEANVARLQSLEETVNTLRGMLEEIKGK